MKDLKMMLIIKTKRRIRNRMKRKKVGRITRRKMMINKQGGRTVGK